jgi:hypothetical protein
MKEGNEMSDTPRTDKIENDWKESWDRSTGQEEMACFARQLERELNQTKAALAAELAMPTHLLDVHAIADERDSLREINAELRKASIDLLKSLPMRSLPMVKCSQFHHERSDLHSDTEECPVRIRYESAIYEMRAVLTKSFQETVDAHNAEMERVTGAEPMKS